MSALVDRHFRSLLVLHTAVILGLTGFAILAN